MVLPACWSNVSAAELFDEDEVIEMRLKGPLNSIFKDTAEREEQSFTVSVDGVSIPVKVRIRGKSRVRVCDFPPLRLNFTGSDAQQTVFDGLSKIKLVTHCRNNKAGDWNVLEEYAAYRIFNILSDASYRTRLVHVTYEDTGRGLDDDAKRHYAFLIEPKYQLGEREGGEFVRLPGVKLSRIEKAQAALVYVFQYLIGNTDWSFLLADGDDACCHNGDLLEKNSRLYFIPYDFDLSGLVNAKYAKPDPSLRLRSVKQRRYRGYCVDTSVLSVAIGQVRSKKMEILNVVQELPEYPEKSVESSASYLEAFFKKAEHESKLLKLYTKRCLD